jgi:hypothetical protein
VFAVIYPVTVPGIELLNPESSPSRLTAVKGVVSRSCTLCVATGFEIHARTRLSITVSRFGGQIVADECKYRDVTRISGNWALRATLQSGHSVFQNLGPLLHVKLS